MQLWSQHGGTCTSYYDVLTEVPRMKHVDLRNSGTCRAIWTCYGYEYSSTHKIQETESSIMVMVYDGRMILKWRSLQQKEPWWQKNMVTFLNKELREKQLAKTDHMMYRGRGTRGRERGREREGERRCMMCVGQKTIARFSLSVSPLFLVLDHHTGVVWYISRGGY